MGHHGRRWLAAAGALLLSLGAARAGELRVLSTLGLRMVFDEVAAGYEARSGDRLAITYDTSGTVKAMAEAGAPFDVVVVTPAMIDDLVRQGRAAAGSGATIARVGLGVAVRKGTPPPDISGVEAFKRTLAEAPSIAYTTTGASTVVLMRVLDRLGIADAVKAKARTIPSGLTGEIVARGEAALAVQLLSELKLVPGVDIVGPFPAELQDEVVLTAAVAASADRGPADGFINYLRTPAVAAVIRAKGMEPR